MGRNVHGGSPLSNSDDAFTDILSLQQANERSGKVLQSIDDVFEHLELPTLDPALEIEAGPAALGIEVGHDDPRSERRGETNQAGTPRTL